MNISNPRHQSDRPITLPRLSRNPWPVAIIAWFAVFISFIGGFIVFASRQNMDLVRPDYYEDEMRFQQQLDRLNRTHSLAAKVAIAYERSKQAIIITLPAAQARRFTSGRIHFYRPSDARLDRELPLVVNADGVQRVETKQLRAGLWKVRLQWAASGEEFFFDQSILVDSPSS